MIKARIKPENTDANLKSYFETYRNFRWSDIENELGLKESGLVNIADHAVDRWAENPETSDKPALILENDGEVETLTYADLKEKSCRLANLLVKYGFKPGDRLFIALPTCTEAYVAIVACARAGVIFSTMFPSLSVEELQRRLENAEPRGLLSNSDFISRLRHDTLSKVKYVFLTTDGRTACGPNEILIPGVINHMPLEFRNRGLYENAPLYMLYTSGAIGPSKGIVHAHRDMVGHLMTGRYVLDLNSESVLWTDGDPAWVTGVVYGAFAPWLCGAASVVQAGPFSASAWYKTLETHKVSVLYTTPMTIKKLMEAGEDLPKQYDFSHLKHMATVGETLQPEQFYWVRNNLKHSPHDTWWMTETGMICIANFPSQPVKPGSMGKPVPGIEAAVLDGNGEPLQMLTLGELGLKADWPTLMKSVWRDEKRYASYFKNGWFLTGDVAVRDEDGYYYYHGRQDDLIKVDQQIVGPFEIEQTMLLHPAVAEAAAIAKGAASGNTQIKVFVVLNQAFVHCTALQEEIKTFVKSRLDEDLPLSEIEFVQQLPRSKSGKVVRRALRAGELGLPLGDVSKLKD